MRPLALAFILATLCPAAAQTGSEPDRADGVTERDVVFESGAVTLAGTVFTPPGAGPWPAVVVTHGSGEEGRRLPGYRWIGWALAEAGFVALVYDKRGVGDSEGVYVETPDLRVPAGDVVAAAAFLAGEADVDPSRIGVLGASQGGWVGPLAATMTDRLAFVVSLNGPGVSVREQVLYQRGEELRARGMATADVDEALAFGAALYAYLGTGEGYGALRPAYAEAVGRPWFAFFRAQGFGEEPPPPEALDAPAYDFFRHIAYDPAPTLARLDVPFLALFGADDRQVPTAASVRAMEAAFAASGNGDVAVRVLEGEGHSLWRRVDGAPEMRPAYREALFAWLKRFE